MTKYLDNNPELQMNLDPENEKNKSKGWEPITNNLIQDLKRGSTIPSLENFVFRVNLYKRPPDKPEIIEYLIRNKEQIMKKIHAEEQKKENEKNKLQHELEAKLRKQTGDVAYFSFRKKYEFQSKMVI